VLLLAGAALGSCHRADPAPASEAPLDLTPAVTPPLTHLPLPAAAEAHPASADPIRAGVATVACSASIGVGFFLSSDTLLTSAERLCPEGETARVLLPDGRELLGALVSRDPSLGLARLRVVGAAATPLPTGDATVLTSGMPVTIPSIVQRTLVTLPEAHLRQAHLALAGLSWMQTDLELHPERVGAPLLDGTGAVVGIVTGAHRDGPAETAIALPSAYWAAPTSPEAITRWQALRAQAEAAVPADAGAPTDAGVVLDAGSTSEAQVSGALAADAGLSAETQWRARFRAARAKLAEALKAVEEAPREKEAMDRRAWRTMGRLSPESAAAYARLTDLVAHPDDHRQRAQDEFHQLEIEAAREEIPLEWRH
jgi:S1-C subfamily serine protease